MRCCLIAILVLASGLCAASASSYSELGLGIDAYIADDWPATILHMTNALASPDLPPGYRSAALIDRGDAYAATGKPDAAIADFSTLLAADPGYLQGYQHRALLYAAMQKYDLAIADMTVLIVRRPNVVASLEKRSSYYLIEKKYDLAIADLSLVVRIEPNWAPGYAELSYAEYLANPADGRAMDNVDKSITLDPKYAAAYLGRALIYRDGGDYRSAAEDYQSAFDNGSSDANTQYWVGVMDWDAGRYEQAAKIFGAPAKDGARRVDIALWQAISLAGENEDYKDELRAAGVASTAWPAAVVNVYLGAADPKSVLASAKASDPQDQHGTVCDAEFYLGEWYALTHDNAAAIPLLQDAAGICPITFFAKTGAAAALRRLQ